MSIEADVSETSETPPGLGESFRSFVGELRDRASVETVYGDPIESHGRTVVPVARVAYGFGGGFGRGGDPDEGRDGDDESTGEGAGGGGGVRASPAGALEITDDGTRFVRFDDRRRPGVALVVGLVLGLVLGRRRSRD